MSLQKLSAALEEKRRDVMQMGGADAVARQHAGGKLTARERIAFLLDSESFTETGVFAHHQNRIPELKGKATPADGVVTGFGTIANRPVCVVAYDFTVMAGAMGEIGEKKISDLRKRALKARVPFIWLLDSAGARIQEAFGAEFAGSGELFYEQSLMSGQIPLVCAVMGPCAAGTAYIPGLADVVFMVEKTGSMALAGPHLVKAAVGEDLSALELGGSEIHCKQSGVADAAFADDKACLDAIKTYLSFFPSQSGEKPPRHSTPDTRLDTSTELSINPEHTPAFRPESRRVDCAQTLYDVLPENPKQGYDVCKVITKLIDRGSFFEIKRDFAKNIVCGLAHMGGQPVGIVANQPSVLGGAIDIDASDKAARFINLCDAYDIPLVFLVDTPGFMVGSQVERQGIIRHGAKLIYQVSNATVPKITVILRKAYGAGYYAMCGKAFGADTVVAWPSAELSVMGAEGALSIIYRKAIEAAKDPEATRTEALRQLREKISPILSASAAHIDDVIDPLDTRRVIIASLETLSRKTVQGPICKRGIPPV